MHGFRCYDDSAEHERSASACTRSVPGINLVNLVVLSDFLHWPFLEFLGRRSVLRMGPDTGRK